MTFFIRSASYSPLHLPFLGVSIHLWLCPTLICHKTLRACLWALNLSIHLSLLALRPSIIHPSIHPYIRHLSSRPSQWWQPPPPPHLFPPKSIHPLSLSALPLPCTSFIFPQSPAVLLSVSEPSPPQTSRPRSPAPRKGSELERRKRSLESDTASFREYNTRHSQTLPSLLLRDERLLHSDQACT